MKVSSDRNTPNRPQYSFELLHAMIRTKGQIRQLFKSLSFSTAHARSTATTMNHSQPFEEERLPWYRADQFYPVHVGETFISRYKVVGKLGYAAYSTVWLCRDMKSRNPPRTILTKNANRCSRDSGFVALKVCIRNEIGSLRNDRELKFYEHVSSLNSQHKGQAYIRGLLETFHINGPAGKHLCLIQPPMHMTIRELQYQNPSKRLNKQILNLTLFNLLNALAFLHDEAKVVHTGEFVITIYLEH